MLSAPSTEVSKTEIYQDIEIHILSSVTNRSQSKMAV